MGFKAQDKRLKDGVFSLRRINDEIPIGVTARLGKVAVANPLVKRPALLLHAILAAADSGEAGCGIYIKDHDEVGLDPVGRDAPDLKNLLGFKAPRRSLVGEGRGNEPIGEHHAPRLKGWADPLTDKLSAAGHIEEHFGANRHFRMLRIQENQPNRLANRRTTGLSNDLEWHLSLRAPRTETVDLR